jgi:hypothetical protein
MLLDAPAVKRLRQLPNRACLGEVYVPSLNNCQERNEGETTSAFDSVRGQPTVCRPPQDGRPELAGRRRNLAWIWLLSGLAPRGLALETGHSTPVEGRVARAGWAVEVFRVALDLLRLGLGE